MDTTALRDAYGTLAQAAATASTGQPADGGWDALHILAHLLSVDAGIADQLSDESSSVLVPAFLLSHDEVVVDEPVPLAGLISGLSTNHIPEHIQQLRELPPAKEFFRSSSEGRPRM